MASAPSSLRSLTCSCSGGERRGEALVRPGGRHLAAGAVAVVDEQERAWRRASRRRCAARRRSSAAGRSRASQRRITRSGRPLPHGGDQLLARRGLRQLGTRGQHHARRGPAGRVEPGEEHARAPAGRGAVGRGASGSAAVAGAAPRGPIGRSATSDGVAEGRHGPRRRPCRPAARRRRSPRGRRSSRSAHGGEAPLRRLLERLADHGVEPVGQVGADGREPRRRLGEMGVDHRHVAVARERHLARQAVEEQAAERVDVGCARPPGRPRSAPARRSGSCRRRRRPASARRGRCPCAW